MNVAAVETKLCCDDCQGEDSRGGTGNQLIEHHADAKEQGVEYFDWYIQLDSFF